MYFSFKHNIDNKKAKLLETLNIKHSNQQRKEERFMTVGSRGTSNLHENSRLYSNNNNFRTHERIAGHENGGIKEKIKNFV